MVDREAQKGADMLLCDRYNNFQTICDIIKKASITHSCVTFCLRDRSYDFPFGYALGSSKEKLGGATISFGDSWYGNHKFNDFGTWASYESSTVGTLAFQIFLDEFMKTCGGDLELEYIPSKDPPSMKRSPVEPRKGDEWKISW